MNGSAARPNPSFGYWRGGGSDGMPLAEGQGSNMGLKQQGAGVFSAGIGAPGGVTWEPTIIYLFILIIAEMFVFGFISRMLR